MPLDLATEITVPSAKGIAFDEFQARLLVFCGTTSSLCLSWSSLATGSVGEGEFTLRDRTKLASVMQSISESSCCPSNVEICLATVVTSTCTVHL